MNTFEVISQTRGGDIRECDGQQQRPLKILTVALTTPLSHDFYPAPLFSLSGATELTQPDLHEITLARSQDAKGIIDFVGTNNIDILALSAPQGTLITLDNTLQGLTESTSDKQPTILLGSSLPTYLPERFFKTYPSLPLTIVGGWGESGFASEVKARSTDAAQHGQLFIHGTYPVDYPTQTGIPPQGDVLFHYPRVEASRGCFWGACSYCLRPLNEKKGKWKQYKPDDVIAQITDVLKLGYAGYFEFADEEPIGTDITRFQEIVDRLIVLRKDYPTFTFGMNMRADHIISPKPDKQTEYDIFLKRAKEAGLTNIWMGAESYSSSHLKILRKGSYITPTTNLEAAKKVTEHGIHMTQGFIPYHPLSTWQELEEMAHFMEPHAKFLSTVLGSPFGFLRVQHQTPYEKMVRKVENDTQRTLLGDLDENMLSYQCRYADVNIGLHVAYMRIFYDWVNPFMKQLNVAALKGDTESRKLLDTLRLMGLNLFMDSIKQLGPLQDDIMALEHQQVAILNEYKERVGNLGLPTSLLDESLKSHLNEYKEKFT